MDLMDILSSASSSETKVTKASYKLMVGDNWLCSVTLDCENKRNNPLHSALSDKQQELSADQVIEILNALMTKVTIVKSSPKVSEKLDLSSLL